MQQCLVCGKYPTDRAHIKSRGSGGCDEEWNIMRLCRMHHIAQHKIGICEFVIRHEKVRIELEKKGWEIRLVLGRRKLVRIYGHN